MWRDELLAHSTASLVELITSDWPTWDGSFPSSWTQVWGMEGVTESATNVLRRFVAGREIADLLEQRFFQTDHPGEQEQLSLAIELVEILGKQLNDRV